MKEATGEANMTVVTIILIAAIVAIATPIVIGMMSSTQEKACCMNNGGIWYNVKYYAKCTNDAKGNVSGCSGSVSTICPTTK